MHNEINRKFSSHLGDDTRSEMHWQIDINDADHEPIGYSVKLHKLQLLSAIMKKDEYASWTWKVRSGNVVAYWR